MGLPPPEHARSFGRRPAVNLTYLNCTQYGRSPGRRLFTRVWVLNETNSTRPLEMSVGTIESGLRRHCMAALRASSSNAGWPLLRSTFVLVTWPLLSIVRDNTT